MATVYLHIGLPKTGTTSLRRFFWAKENQEILAKHGICFPDLGFRYRRQDGQAVAKERNAHFLIAPFEDENGVRDSSRPSRDYETAWQMIEQLARHYEKILLTDEGIWKGSRDREDFWPKLKEDLDRRGLDIRIIVYVRRQDDWLESYYAQNLKDGDTSDILPDFIVKLEQRQYPRDYYAYMNMLAGIFGKEALILRVFEKEQFRGAQKSIFSDFLEIFGLTLEEGFVVEKEALNLKFAGNYLEMRRILNYLPQFRRRHQLLLDNLEELQAQNVWGHDYRRMSSFSQEERQAYLASFADSNRLLAKEYLGREDGVLFREATVQAESQLIDRDELLYDVLLACAKALDDLAQENRRQKLEIRELTRANQKWQKKMAKELSELRENVLWYRLKRKTRNLLGKNTQES